MAGLETLVGSLSEPMDEDANTAVQAPDATRANVGRVSELDLGQMKMARVGEYRVVVARTLSGIHALDNACPHQGYGLVTGDLQGELITCQWHNWKFCVADGNALVGEEAVRCHPVEVIDDEIWVELTTPSNAQQRDELWPSLGRAVESDYRGQIARDAARLLQTGADPVDIVWHGLKIGAPKADYGVGHEMASAADCLASVELFDGLDRILPVTHALTGFSETTRDRIAYEPPKGDPSIDFLNAVESERADDAVAALRGALADGATVETVRSWFIEAASAHHLSYGHGAIYVQKAFELLERAGWHRADDLLPHLTTSIVYGTREDTLPYMSKANRGISDADLHAIAAAPDRAGAGWSGEPELRATLLDSEEAPIGAAVEAVIDGAGILGLLNSVSLAVSERLLRYDQTTENDPRADFGWLDISHGLTYSRSARWAWEMDPSPATARLALFAVFLCHDTGRMERRVGVVQPPSAGSPDGDLSVAIQDGRAADAVAIAARGEIDDVGDALRRVALTDAAGSFIVSAHLVKMARASWEEARATGSNLPLMATARLAASPRRERFVERAAIEAARFVNEGTPPTR